MASFLVLEKSSWQDIEIIRLCVYWCHFIDSLCIDMFMGKERPESMVVLPVAKRFEVGPAGIILEVLSLA